MAISSARLALEVLAVDGDDGAAAAFDKVSKQAAAIVCKHWGEIAAA